VLHKVRDGYGFQREDNGAITLVINDIGVFVMSPYEWAEVVEAMQVSFPEEDDSPVQAGHAVYD